MIKFIQVDNDIEIGKVCCRRYYFYSLHSKDCQRINNFKIDTDLHYAEANKDEPMEIKIN